MTHNSGLVDLGRPWTYDECRIPRETFERMKECFARSIWKIRYEMVPGKGYNWCDSFRKKFGEEIEGYAKRLRAEKDA